ncbi:MAG TPA: ABC transporter permease [Candidatus Acidoferrales bacterium]|nr:ABC transporter permease [Candidatus Acidoferrales bacterium]
MFEAAESMSIPSLFGEKVKRWVFALQDYTLLSIQSISNIFTPPQYWGDTLLQMDVIGVGSFSIVAIAALFIGGVTVLDTASQFSRFGMTALTGNAVSIAMVRELGPTITALLVAGRNASGIASELGSMVVTEQIDAMRALGTDPIRKLMTPRVLATVFVLPLLVATADFLGLVGGYIMAYLTLRVGAVQFWTQAVDALALGDLITGLAKPLVFAFIIATIGCYQGLRVRGGTEGVGRATTSAVVVSSVAILIANLFVDRLFLYIFNL